MNMEIIGFETATTVPETVRQRKGGRKPNELQTKLNELDVSANNVATIRVPVTDQKSFDKAVAKIRSFQLNYRPLIIQDRINNLIKIYRMPGSDWAKNESGDIVKNENNRRLTVGDLK